MTRRRNKDKRDKHQKRSEEGSHRIVKEKFQEQRLDKIIPLQAKNDNQRKALSYFGQHQMVILSGFAGTGKTELACWYAAKRWLQGDIDNIIITRPYQHLGTDFGATKGNDAEKLLVFCMSMLMKLKKYLGAGILKNNFKLDGFESLFSEADGIQIVPVEKIQGMSYNSRTLIIADETQNMTIPQMKSLVTRAEEGCQILLCGDPLQTAIGRNNGLNFIEATLDKYPTPYANIVHFSEDDVVRGGLSGHFVRIFEKAGTDWSN